MKLTIFQSEEGDSLLLTSQAGKKILVDGGPSSALRITSPGCRLPQRREGWIWSASRTSTATTSAAC